MELRSLAGNSKRKDVKDFLCAEALRWEKMAERERKKLRIVYQLNEH